MVRRFRMYLSLFLLLDLVAAGAIFYYNCKEGIPDEIWVEEGKKNIDLPFGCNVKKGEKTVDALSNTSKDYEIPVELFYCIPVKTIHAKAAEKVQVAPAGDPIGIYVETKGLLVLDTAEIPGKDGMTYAPAHNLLKTGDYILQWNHIVVSTIKQLNQEIQKTGNKKVPVKIRRNSEEMEVAIRPIRSSDNKFRIGTWVREDTQGIGTLTYVTSNGKFGTLGHGISDIDTKMLLKLRGGEVYKSQIIGIQKGKEGEPGELKGYMNMTEKNLVGKVLGNTEKGVYGKVNSEMLEKYKNKFMPIVYRQHIKKGKAYIVSKISGKTERYEIMIEEIAINSHDNKSMVIHVTDERLLELTGGIVQGMSGSPIIQNGGVVGAVTHVYVDDPTRGYAIFMEEMLEQ